MHRFSNLGIQKKTVLIILSIYLVSLLILGSIFTSIYYYEQREQRETLIQEIVKETSRRLTDFLVSTDELTYNVMYSTWVQRTFDKGLSHYERRVRIQNVKTVMNTLSFLNSDIQFAIYTLDGTRFNSNDWFQLDQDLLLEDQSWFQNLEMNRKYVWSGKNQPFFYRNKEWCIVSFYGINNINSLDLEAYAGVRISMETLQKSVFDIVSHKDCYLSFIDSEGQTLYTEVPIEQQGTVGELILKSDETVMTKGKYTFQKIQVMIGDQKYYLAGILPNEKVRGMNGLYWAAFLGIIILIGIVLLTIAAAISHYITKPVVRCRDAMMEIARNNIGITVANPYQDEFGAMLDSFNDMSVSIADLIKINRNISALQKEAEYKLLERQINPHFLFNNLELINALILSEKPEKARKVCETLGELYHYNLQQAKYITLQEEMEYTREYLYLMTYKIHNLTVYYDFEEKLKDIQIPKVILQPLVENAIKHGFVNGNREYCITITAESDEGDVLITVMDNGCGMTEEKLALLKEALDRIMENPETAISESSHIGIKNVVQRLKLEYGKCFSIEIHAKEGYGVRIELRIREEVLCIVYA